MLEEKQNTGTKVVLQDQHHIFLLRRVDSQSASFVQVDFSPITPSLDFSPASPRLHTLHTLPTFNPDRRHFTPAFILPLEQLKIQEHTDTYLRLHNQKRTEMSDQRDQLLVPKPSKANSFCCICKKTFEDYLTHINMPSHQALLEGSDFRADILALSLQFNAKAEQPKQPKVSEKSRRIKKTGRKSKKTQKVSNQQSSTTVCNQNSFAHKTIAV